MYVPAALVSTVLVAVMLADISPSTLSRAVAPASVYVAPWFTETGDVPDSVITGASVSSTLTILTSAEAVLPAASATL